MAAEGYWRYGGESRQQAAAATAAMRPQLMAPPPVAAPPLKRSRVEFSDMPGAVDIPGYYPREDERPVYRVIRDTEPLGASYDRYLRNGLSSLGGSETSRTVATAISGYGAPVEDRRVLPIEGRGTAYGGKPEPALPQGASNTLYVEGLPGNCTRREVSHIFRPFFGFREVRLVNKESRNPGGEPHVLCFVDFSTAAQAAVALEALQGYVFDEHDRESANLRLQFSRFPGPRSAGGPRGRR